MFGSKEMLATYVTLYEHLSSSKLLPITPSDLMTRVWDLINRKREWKALSKGGNVEELFREFNFVDPRHHRSLRGSKGGRYQTKFLQEQDRYQ
ncbi:MAG: hypothetical protein ACKPKO_27185 [Candidatus Fonsibacter sp.]